MDDKQIFEKLKEQGYVRYGECPTRIDLDNKDSYVELELTDGDKLKLVESFPGLAEMLLRETVANINLPEGISETLMVLVGGVMSSAMLGQVAALGGAAVLGAFSILMIFTGQFFLLSIKKEFEKINQKLDKILDFLRRDKESTLLSEVNFMKYACDNYSLIMPNEPQRVATIANIQQSKKEAMKDIEFYLKEFKGTVKGAIGKKGLTDLKRDIDGAVRIEENLDFALQLYIMSSLMEVCYAQNYEPKYIENLKNYVMEYVENCKENLLTGYGQLRGCLGKEPAGKGKTAFNSCKKTIDERTTPLRQKYKDMCDKAYEVLEKSTQNANYYIKKEGGTYRIFYKK